MKKWAHTSSEALAVAGYKCRGPIVCPLCGSEIVIYQVPGYMPVFLDPGTFYPHLMEPQHSDPPWQPPVDGKSAAAGDRA